MNHYATSGASARWTKDEIATCKRMWREGKSAAEISRKLGRSRDAVIGKWWRLGLSDDQRKLEFC